MCSPIHVHGLAVNQQFGLVSEYPHQGISTDNGWVILRPLLRLAFWLVPEHIPAGLQLQEGPVAAQGNTAGRQKAAGREHSHNQQVMGVPATWRHELAESFLKEVVTVSQAAPDACTLQTVQHS
jgi:hypothetical protein